MDVKEEDVQKTRDELFMTDNEVLRSFAPMLRDCLAQNQYCVFGNAQNIESAQTEFKEKTTV